ncbi:MAG: xanthine dehydrogenase family protein molybdopterin-binding subunit, partial [Gammaproteobacteria bacterium]
PMLIAEELNITLDHPGLIIGHPTEMLPAYSNFVIATAKRLEDHAGPLDWTMRKAAALFPYIGTGGSTSVVDGYESLRTAGAMARELLTLAAAKRWGISAEQLQTEDGYVINPERNERLQYSALADDAAKADPPARVALKPRAEWRLIGQSIPRTDLVAKTTGAPLFGTDVQHEDMLYAFIVHAPVLGDKVESLNGEAIRKLSRIIAVINLDSAVAVVGETYHHARLAAQSLEINYADGGYREFSDSDVANALDRAFDEGDEHVAEMHGDISILNDAEEIIAAEYALPYLAHACMEPMNCTARYDNGDVTMWAPVQTPLALKWAAEKHVDDLKVLDGHVTYAGGGFGRRSEMDFTSQAMRVAREIPGRAVKLIWSREEDIQHEMYRPAAKARFRAVRDAHGNLQALDLKVAVQSVTLSYSNRSLPIPQGGVKDPLNTEGLTESPYLLPNIRISAFDVELPVPVGYWRSVGHSINAFFMESCVV